MNDKQLLFTSFHSGTFYCASSSPLLLTSALDTARILCRSFTPKHHRQLAQGPYEAASAGFQPATLRMKVIESTNVPPRHTNVPETINYQDLYSAPSK